MTYSQKANPNATNSELDAKVIIKNPNLLTKKQFIPEVEEDLNREHKVTLTEGQISTILYVLEGYVEENNDNEVFRIDLDKIFESLEGTLDRFYQRPNLGTDSTTYEDLK